MAKTKDSHGQLRPASPTSKPSKTENKPGSQRSNALAYAFLVLYLLLLAVFSGCHRIQEILRPEGIKMREACRDVDGVLNVGFYAYFAPVSYSADPDPMAEGFNKHLGYEADLLTALEALEDTGISFSRKGIATWNDIWLKAAESEYDLIAGGITILDARTQDATGTPRIAFTSGHIKFRQSLLVRTEDAQRLSTYSALSRDVRVGALSGTTGEVRLLEITGIVDANGVLVEGTRIQTLDGSLVCDGTPDYRITAAGATANLADRQHLYPPNDNMPEVIYLGEEVGESALLDALSEGRIDAIARGEIGNRNAAYARDGFVVALLDDKVEYGGFTLAVEDKDLLACIDQRINYLTDGGNIDYAQWLADPTVFIRRAEMWNAMGR